MVKSLSWLFKLLKMNVVAEPMAWESNSIPAGNGIQGAQLEKCSGAPQGWGKDYLEDFTGRKGQKGGSGWTAGGISSWKGWICKDLKDSAALPPVFALSLHPVIPYGQLGSARTRHWEGGCCPDPA